MVCLYVRVFVCVLCIYRVSVTARANTHTHTHTNTHTHTHTHTHTSWDLLTVEEAMGTGSYKSIYKAVWKVPVLGFRV